jgi:uncharacterized membrane protein
LPFTASAHVKPPFVTWRVRSPVHPGLVAHLDQRAKSVQNRIADLITRFAGSMPFIYVHIIWFTLWIALPVEAFHLAF